MLSDSNPSSFALDTDSVSDFISSLDLGLRGDCPEIILPTSPLSLWSEKSEEALESRDEESYSSCIVLLCVIGVNIIESSS